MSDDHHRNEARRASRRDRDDRSPHSHRRRSRSPDRKRARRSSNDDRRTENRRGEGRSRDDDDKNNHKPSGSSSNSKRHHHHRHEKRQRQRAVAEELPFSARYLVRGDLVKFEYLFAYYLDLQKQIDINELDEREVRGRWKSFVGKWNRGELAEGWYDPDMFRRIEEEAIEAGPRVWQETSVREEKAPAAGGAGGGAESSRGSDDSDDDDDDEYGPGMMMPSASGAGRRAGPGIPSLRDLAERDHLSREDATEAREAEVGALREARRVDRALQKERLDEVAPRADAGSHERKMEKRRLVNDKMREFRDKDGGTEPVDDKQLMGGGDELEEYKRARQREQRRKTEREVRREEIQRAKQEEFEVRKKAYREREEGTMGMLKELARQRFG
ncbi:hypothetical protein N3K66_004860 [Trichothecium roseum]|uniref:Uncharacterized protein n=1 Tax=Trichothecium roseum TaxID=47278 RepID=A0ACC0V451_9HYPO|nr:hypothetical protein N3K66_004860 [Trichothecium roseum]